MGWNSTTKKLRYPLTKIAANGQGDLQLALKTGRTSQADIFAYGVINPYALYKAACINQITPPTLTQRANIFHGLVPFNMTQILNYHLGVGTGADSVTAKFTTPEKPSAWTYNRPTIGNYPLRVYDFLHVESDTSEIGSKDGYFADAKAPLSLRTNTLNINLGSTKGPVDYDLFNFSQNGQSQQSMGSYTNIEIFLDYLKPRTALGGEYAEPFFTEGGSRTPSGYTWQFAIAVACKVSASEYTWVIVSSELPFGDWWWDSSWTTTDQVFQHRICFGSNMAAGPLGRITTAARTYGQTDFLCIPFLAQNLNYNSSTGVWYFAAGSSTAKALTFPNGDYFTARFDGITTTMTMALVEPRTYTVGGTSHTINVTVTPQQTLLVYMTIPVPASATTSGTFSFGFNFTGYGRNTNFTAGVNGVTGSVTLRDSSSNIITEIGTAGASSVTQSGTISFSTSAVSAIVYNLPSSVTYYDTTLTISWNNVDTGMVVTRNYPIRINISR